MRMITDLSPETIGLLLLIYKDSKYYRVRQRAHCIYLSSQGYSTTELMKMFTTTRLTIYNWFNSWESRRFAGLYDKPGKGRKCKLSPEQKDQIREWAKQFPRRLSKVCGLVNAEFDISVCKRTIKRLLKSVGFSFRRICCRPKGKPNPEEYQRKKQELTELKEQHKQGQIDLRYFDESGFCLTPYVPYAWQEVGETIEVDSSRSQRINVLGFMNTNNELDAYTIEGNVNTATVIACMDIFCKNLTKKTVVVMDNASVHTSKAFESKILAWEEKGLVIFRLPPYSPELNLIEILWRFMKYEWIEFDAYKSYHSLVAYVEKVIKDFGKEYMINFV